MRVESVRQRLVTDQPRHLSPEPGLVRSIDAHQDGADPSLTGPTMKPTAAQLERVLSDVADELAGSLPGGRLQIGDGSCEAVVEDVLGRLGATETVEFFAAETFSFTFNDDRGPDGFDQDSIARSAPATVPPPGMGWNELEDLGLHETGHAWLVLDGRHYDADALGGVDSFLDLPIFRRNLGNELVLRDPARLAGFAAAHPWWAETSRLAKEYAEACTVWRATAPKP